MKCLKRAYSSVAEQHEVLQKQISGLFTAMGNRDLVLCDPRILMAWSKSCYALAWSGRLLANFLEIPCEKHYISGNALTVEETTFLKEHKIDHIVLATGHWVMIDAPDLFCQHVYRILRIMAL